MVLFRCVVEVERHSVKKNNKSAFFNKRTGKAWVTRNKDSIRAEDHLVQHLQIERNRQLHGETLSGDLHVKLIFRFKDYYTDKMQRNKRLPDLDNLFCLPLDSLSKARVIQDDSQVCSLDGGRRIPGQSNNIEIIIYRFVD